MAHALAQASATGTLRSLLEQPRRCTLIAHHNPDGDAMGSCLGLARVLTATGHEVQVVMPNRPAPFLDWMPGRDRVLPGDTHTDQAKAALRSAELVFCLDFNRPDRVGALEADLMAAPYRILIDHHQEPADMAHLVFSDTTACSTAQLVYDLVVALGLQEAIDTDAATCLYTGIMTDSGSFRFNSTTAHTHRVVADLLDKGVKPDRVHGAIMDENTTHRMKLLGFTLSQRLEVHPEWKLATIVLDRQDLEAHHFHPGDTEGFVNYGLSIQGVRLSAFFMERPDGVKISVRSKGDLAVDGLMKTHFDGGGHANAAGGRSQEPIDRVVDRFMRLMPTLFNTAGA